MEYNILTKFTKRTLAHVRTLAPLFRRRRRPPPPVTTTMSSASTSANACIDQTPTMKSPSFTDPYADVILISSDGVEFHVLKGILVMVSLFFRDMFRLPQPAGGNEYEPGVDGSEESCTAVVEAASKSSSRSPSLPRIQVSEDSCTLDFLLCTIYPVQSPTIDMKKTKMQY